MSKIDHLPIASQNAAILNLSGFQAVGHGAKQSTTSSAHRTGGHTRLVAKRNADSPAVGTK